MANNTKINEREERIKKLEEFKKLNIDPYPAKSHRNHVIADVLKDFKKLEKTKKKITICGRLRTMRSHGNLTFVNIQDASGIIQIALSKAELKENYKTFIKLIDMGDFVEIEGECFVTHKGEESVLVKNWKILSKAIRPLPDKWHGIKDDEDRYRKRYLDILFNDELKEIFIKKSKFWDVTRSFMIKNGFFEVETPTLEFTTGGAEATPFKTHHNDYDVDLFLRISVGELWQKRLMAAGFEKTFEIGRIYRNEGSSPEHTQEFTNMEFYWAYADYEDGMKLTQKLYQTIANDVFGTMKFQTRGHKFDFSGDWKKIDYQTEIKKQTGIDVLKDNEEKMKKKLDELKVKYEGENRERLIDTLWKYCRKNISGPVFLVNHPKLVSPLAKEKKDSPGLTERFQIIIAGSEVGNGYNELNNPIDQAKRFEEQKKLLEAGDNEAMMSDDEFVEMLEHGMPPTCGFGFGERLFAFLADKTLRESTLFPLMKPKNHIPSSVSHNVKSEELELGIDYKKAKKLVDKHIKDKFTKLHMIETEAIMRALAKHFNEDEEKWGIIGLLHDIDWEITKDNTDDHGVEMVAIIKNAGGTDFLIDTIQSHIYGHGAEEFKNKRRSTRLQHALAASETLTGLIIASALMQPDKKLASVKLSSLKKKFKTCKFAANCNRDIINECEKIDIPIDDFLKISLEALQNISDELGL